MHESHGENRRVTAKVETTQHNLTLLDVSQQIVTDITTRN